MNFIDYFVIIFFSFILIFMIWAMAMSFFIAWNEHKIDEIKYIKHCDIYFKDFDLIWRLTADKRTSNNSFTLESGELIEFYNKYFKGNL